MFATRDQENLVHAHQTTAANKPLNQSIRALQPKTPGNHKTPFRAPANDENKLFIPHGQKTLGGEGPSRLDKNAFITPAAPRNRAPLGAKTTNVKGQAFRTPGPQQQTQKPEKMNKLSTSRRSGRSKIKVAQEPPQVIVTEQNVEEDEPDFGYAPPPIAELPDPAFEFGYDDTFPQFRPENMFKGYQEVFFGSPKDENGLSIRLRKEEEEWAAFQAKQENKIAAQIAEQNRAALRNPNEEVEAMIAAGPKFQPKSRIMESRLDTVKAKAAAAALSDPKSRPFSVATKQTASSRAKNVSSKPLSNTTVMINPPSNVSKNTIGFPKARKPISIIPSGQQMKNEHAKQQRAASKPITTLRQQNDMDPKQFVKLYGEPPEESDMWFRLRREERLMKDLDESAADNDVIDPEVDDLASDFFETGFLSSAVHIPGAGDDGGGDEDDDVFQLQMPDEEN